MPMVELTVAQALAELLRDLTPIIEDESIAIGDAAGRVLAADVVSRLDLPAFDNSAMDGYALRFDDLRPGHWLHEIGRAYAGHGFSGRVDTGTCVRIMTGAPVPEGTDTVVMREDVSVEAETVRIERLPEQGANIRRRGEHIARGSVILHAGRHLRAADIGLAAASGCAQIAVRRRLRVGILSTGDELADPPQPLSTCGSYDANRPLLHASLQRLGFDALDLGICRDSTQCFIESLDRALGQHLDGLVVSGGAAQGDADVVRAASGVRFVPLNIRPGRGVAFARIERDGPALVLLGLPGNAVAAFVMFHLLVRPLLLHLAGSEARLPLHVPLPLAGAAQLRGGRIDYRRARLVPSAAGRLCVQPLRDQGSAMLRTVTEADALVALGPRDHYAAGDLVDTVPLALLD
jgi:molybdopterin molybdotransferase